MLFNRKPAFFLDLGSEGATPAKVAIAEPKPSAAKAAEPKAAAALAANPAPAPATKPSSSQPSLTTAEAIAAELRTAQEALPAPSLTTFAPECLNPANALPSRRRLAGANLAGYKAMAAGMFRN
ncbi:MAG: hypothetical protein ACI9IO_001430 [Cyanobium sp.]|jgi:hypothetical protein